jgi:hypothetical protein
MYPLQCTAGYPMPVKDGKFEIVAVGAKFTTAATAYEIAIWDTGVNALIDEDNPPVDARRIFHFYGKDDASPFCVFPDPLKTRKGISIGTIGNIDPGQIYVYVK